MSYLNAPATKMLATHCAVCSRDLCDAVSVDLGIGPDCRKKYGYNQTATEEERAMANKLVHEVACHQTGAKAVEAAAALKALGFHKLADRILERLIEVQIVAVGAEFKVTTPYSEEIVAAMRGVPGRRWDKEAKANFFPQSSRMAIWALLRKYLNGATALGPKGVFTIGDKSEQAPNPAVKAAPTQADALANNQRIDAAKPVEPNHFEAKLFDFTPEAITVDASTLQLNGWPPVITIIGRGDFKKALTKQFEGETLMGVYTDLSGKLPPLRIFNT